MSADKVDKPQNLYMAFNNVAEAIVGEAPLRKARRRARVVAVIRWITDIARLVMFVGASIFIWRLALWAW